MAKPPPKKGGGGGIFQKFTPYCTFTPKCQVGQITNSTNGSVGKWYTNIPESNFGY